MNFFNNRYSILLGSPAPKDIAEFHFVRSSPKDSVRMLLAVFFLLLMILGACVATYNFNILTLFSSGEGLFALTNCAFALIWLLAWGLGLLFCVYIVLLSVYEQQVVVIDGGVLEVSKGLAFFRVGFRAPVSEVRHIDMRTVQDSFAAHGKYKKFLISLNNKVESIYISYEFKGQNFETLQAALLTSKARHKIADSESLEEFKALGFISPDVDQSRYALVVLLLANLSPLFGAYFWGWQLADIMLIYWAETLILFIYQSIANIVISPVDGATLCLINSLQFIAFATLHFLFIWVYFVQGNLAINDDSLITVFSYLIRLWPVFLAIFINHGYSLCLYLYKNHGAHKTLLSVRPLLFRIVLLHITLTAGASVVLLSNGHWATLLMLVSLKIVVDLRAFRKQGGFY